MHKQGQTRLRVPDAVTIIPVSVGAASYALFGFVKDAMVVVPAVSCFA